MSMLLGPPGTVPVRQYLRDQGYLDSDIGWDQAGQQVLLQGSPLLKPPANLNGTTFASQADIDNALQSRQTNVVNPRNRLMSLLDQLEQQINQPMSMDFTGNPLYQQAMAAASQGAQGASREALEMLNARGILNSDQSASTVAQIQQQALQQAQANITPTLLNALLQERQMGMQGLLGGIESYLGLEGLDLQTQQLQLQRQVEQLNAAIERTKISGRVSNFDAQILGIPAGTPSWQAQDAIAQRQHELDMLSQQLKSQERIAGMSKTSTDNQILMDIWRFTGEAPQGLEGYGIKAGTPYNDRDYSNLLAKLEYEEQSADLEKYHTMMDALPEIQKQFGVSKETAQAIYGIWENPDRASALADYSSATGQAVIEELKADKNAVRKAIDQKWPRPAGEKESWQESWQNLSQDPLKAGGLAAILTLIALSRRMVLKPWGKAVE